MATLTIAHLSDLHMETAPDTYYAGVRQALWNGAAVVQREAPDLIIVSGDLTSYGGADISQLREAKRWLDALGIAYLAIPGNHDVGPSLARGLRHPRTERYEDTAWDRTHFARVFGQGPTVCREVGAIRVIGIALREGDPDGALGDLRLLLAQAPKPTVLFGHYPLVPVRSGGVLATFGAADFIPRTSMDLFAIIRAHPEIFLYSCGHVHAASVTALPSGPVQISAGGFGPGPSQWWLYSVTETRLRYQSFCGAGPRTFWDRLTGDDTYDETYHWGPASAQSGEIVWSPPERPARTPTL